LWELFRGASFWGSGREWGGGLRGWTSLPNIMGVRSPGTLRVSLKGGSENGAILSMGTLLGEPGGGGVPLLEALRVMKERL